MPTVFKVLEVIFVIFIVGVPIVWFVSDVSPSVLKFLRNPTFHWDKEEAKYLVTCVLFLVVYCGFIALLIMIMKVLEYIFLEYIL